MHYSYLFRARQIAQLLIVEPDLLTSNLGVSFLGRHGIDVEHFASNITIYRKKSQNEYGPWNLILIFITLTLWVPKNGSLLFVIVHSTIRIDTQ
jgi:hypothetical protein